VVTASVPLLPKLRGHFAEFLNHGSPDRLGILYLTTCVGLGYGRFCHSLEVFLDSMGSLTSPQSARHQISDTHRTDLPALSPTSLPADQPYGLPSPRRATLLRHPIACLLPDRVTHSPTHAPKGVHRIVCLASPASAWAQQNRYGNINPLSIDYACRPRLRTRLTQGGLAWPWNP
jgi:hypothetical protein